MKMQPQKTRTVSAVLVVYLLCFALRLAEYFVLRTDQGFWGEAFVHKLAGIGVLFAAARLLSVKKLGFRQERQGLRLLQGLGLGFGAFCAAYGAEFLLLASQGQEPSLEVYVNAYGGEAVRRAPLFFLLCFAGNGINVVMEEGLFRGLFQRLLERRYSFWVSAGVCSLLFGLWHTAGPLRSWLDGLSSPGAAAAQGAVLAITSALVGFKWALLTKQSGGLAMAMGDHFFNNTIVNLLHVSAAGQADSLMSLRIALAQLLSFCVVAAFAASRRRNRPGKRAPRIRF